MTEPRPGKPHEWLEKTWRHYSKAGTYDVDMAQWITVYPNLLDLMNASDGSFEALPNPGITLDDGKTPALVTITLMPQTLEQLKAAPRERPGPKTHATQVTRALEDGTKLVIDTRNLSGAVLSTPERAARSCLYWLDLFKDPETPPGQKTKMRMNLERADALWGRNLEQENPGLYLRMTQALGHPEKSALNPILAVDDMEAGF